MPASPSKAVDILGGRGDLSVFGGWGASGQVCYGQAQEVIVGALVGAGVTQGPGVDTITGATPLLGLNTTCVGGSFSGPGTANGGVASYLLTAQAPDGGSVAAAECVQTPGAARVCVQL